MKRIFLIIALFMAVAAVEISCESDKITVISTQNGASGDDNISNTNFDRTVYVTFSPSGSANVSGAGENLDVTVVSNAVTISNNGTEVVMYVLSGTTSDGFFKLYSDKRAGITLKNASITNKTGAAINVQGTKSTPQNGKRTFVVVEGSNSLSDGSSYSNTPVDEDEKGVIFAEGQLVFSGNGSLTVNASGKTGINSDKYVSVNGSVALTINADSKAGHGIRGAEYISVTGGNIGISVAADSRKGMKSDGYVQIDGGNIDIDVSGSAAFDNEDQTYSGTAGVKAVSYFRMNGGSLTIKNSGVGGKGINCDGQGYFAGGTIDVTTSGANYNSGDISSKAIKFTGNMTFSGSNVSASCAANEAIESKGTITVSDGVVYGYSAKDDALNSGGDFTVSGGFLCAHSAANDGIDANGNCYIKGGVIYAIGAKSPEVAIDANTEGGYKLYVQGGTLIAIGGLEKGSSLSQNCYSSSSWSKNTWYSINDGSATYAFKTPSSGGSGLVVSGANKPSVLSNVTVSGGISLFGGNFVTDGNISGGSEVSLSAYNSKAVDNF